MEDTSSIRKGLIMEYKGKLFEVVEFLHVKPGKGGAFVRTKLKNIQTGQVIDNTFRSGEKIKQIRVEARKMDYLYNDGEFYIFMDNKTFEQISITKQNLGESLPYLVENTRVKVKFDVSNENTILGIDLPSFVVLKITDCEPNVKGNTAASSGKNAVAETGLSITVPFFIEIGDRVKIDTRSGNYIERV